MAGGMHGSTAEPPATSMFVRAGSTNSKKTISMIMQWLRLHQETKFWQIVQQRLSPIDQNVTNN